MVRVQEICDFLERLAPGELAESWDNTGLLLGDPSEPLKRVMTCLTITPDSAQEAIADRAQLIVVHHPLPFRPLTRITTATSAGGLLWQLARVGISVYSAHTRYDSSATGINQQLGLRLGLRNLRPLAAAPTAPDSGTGRIGELAAAITLQRFAESLKKTFGLARLDVVGRGDAAVHSVAIACGSGGSLLDLACQAGCDTFLTGETNFHTALDCQARGVNLALLGHFASERFALEVLAQQLAAAFPRLSVWPSRCESDPFTTL